MTPTNEAGHGLPEGIIERLAAGKDQLPRGSDERNAVWQAIEYLRKPETGALSRGVPETGSWIAADDVYRHARTIDVALNGEDGAASRPALCDVVAQIASLARQHGPLADALSAPAAAGEQGQEYAASGFGHRMGKHGPGGSIQCEYCGEAPQPAAADGGVRELPSVAAFASAMWRDWMTNEQADKLGAELHAWLSAHFATALSSHRQAGDESIRSLHARFMSDTSGLSEEWQDWRNDFARDIRALVEKGAGNG